MAVGASIGYENPASSFTAGLRPQQTGSIAAKNSGVLLGQPVSFIESAAQACWDEGFPPALHKICCFEKAVG